MRTPLILIVLVIAGCSARPQPLAQCDLNNPASTRTDTHLLHNVHYATPTVISGAAPDSDSAFDELKALGVQTILSVDGAAPDVARAASRGLRYVHIPITYATVTQSQQLEIARAIRDLPGPIYIHCHHGKHRSPAAVAAALIALGRLTPEQGVAFMHTAGTAQNYQGLYACVAAASIATPAAVSTAPDDFPAVRKPQGLVAEMVHCDEAFENLSQIQKAGWTTPSDHPDLVPAAEAGALADHLRYSGQSSGARRKGEDFARAMLRAVERAGSLEELIAANAPREKLDSAWKLVQSSCKDCHSTWRDNE